MAFDAANAGFKIPVTPSFDAFCLSMGLNTIVKKSNLRYNNVSFTSWYLRNSEKM